MGRDRLVLVHGFTQTPRSWDRVAARLAEGFDVVRVDVPGHGAAAAVRRTFEDAAAALGDAGGAAVYVGYSLGARLCLRLAVDRPELVTRLVLVGGSPGLDSSAERAERRRADERLAEEIERIGVEPFLDSWLDQPLFASLTPTEDDLAARRMNTPDGLAYALRRLGTGAQEPLWDRLGSLAMPVLLVAGDLDAKFVAIGQRMAAAIGDNAALATMPGCGHAAHLEHPELFCQTIMRFLHAAYRDTTESMPSTGSRGSATTSASRPGHPPGQ